jgi:predicted Zn-dependent protease
MHIPSIKKLAEARIRNGQYPEALAHYIALPEDSHDHNTLENFALLAESLDKHEDLFRALTLTTRKHDLATVEPYLQIAEAAAYLNSSRPAIKVLEEGLTRFPESPALRVALGNVWLRDLNDIDSCYAVLKHPAVKQSFEGVSMLLEISGMVPDRNDLMAFLGSDIESRFSLSPQTRLDLASLCFACGQGERSERLFATVPEDNRHLIFLAEARVEMNAPDEAIRLMVKYVTNNPRCTSDDWMFLGELYENTGRTEDAERAYEHSLGLLTSDLTDNRSAVNNEPPQPPDQQQ